MDNAHELIAQIDAIFHSKSVAVVGVPDDTLGEALKAVVVLSNDQVADAKAVQDHCRLKLGLTKVPTHVIFTDALPRYQSGKVNKSALV